MTIQFPKIMECSFGKEMPNHCVQGHTSPEPYDVMGKTEIRICFSWPGNQSQK
jgi:hypothetical protein